MGSEAGGRLHDLAVRVRCGQAKAETGLPIASFPATPPFTFDEAEDETFVPMPAV